MAMSSLLMDGGLRDCVSLTARDHMAWPHAAPAGDPGAGSYGCIMKSSLVLVRKRVSLELF